MPPPPLVLPPRHTTEVRSTTARGSNSWASLAWTTWTARSLMVWARAASTRIVQLLVERVDISPEGINISLRIEGLAQLAGELKPAKGRRAAA